MAKSTTVVLLNTANNTTQEFEITHAERILRMPNNGGWTLPENSPFIFIENGIEHRPSKESDTNAKKGGRNKQGGNTSESN